MRLVRNALNSIRCWLASVKKRVTLLPLFAFVAWLMTVTGIQIAAFAEGKPVGYVCGR